MLRILNKGSQKIKATVVLMPKNVLDINAISSIGSGSLGGVVGGAIKCTAGQFFDTATAFLGRNVSMQLISATKTNGLFSLPTYNHSFSLPFLVSSSKGIFYI